MGCKAIEAVRIDPVAGADILEFSHKSVEATCAIQQFTILPDGLSDSELAGLLQVSRMTANRYRHQLHAVKVHPGRYCLVPRREEIDKALDLLHVAISSALLDPRTVFYTLQSKNRAAID